MCGYHSEIRILRGENLAFYLFIILNTIEFVLINVINHVYERSPIWLWDFYSTFIHLNGADKKLKLISVQLVCHMLNGCLLEGFTVKPNSLAVLVSAQIFDV